MEDRKPKPETDDDKRPFATLSELAKLFGVHARTLKREKERHARFPRPLPIGRKEVYEVAAVIAFFRGKGRATS